MCFALLSHQWHSSTGFENDKIQTAATERKRTRPLRHVNLGTAADNTHSRVPQGTRCDVNGVVRLIERVVVQGVSRGGLYPPLPPAAGVRVGARHGAGAGARGVNPLGHDRVPVAETHQRKRANTNTIKRVHATSQASGTAGVLNSPIRHTGPGRTGRQVLDDRTARRMLRSAKAEGRARTAERPRQLSAARASTQKLIYVQFLKKHTRSR